MNSSDDEPISKAIGRRKGKVSRRNDSGSETDEESVEIVAKKGKKKSRDDRSLSSEDSDSESSADEEDDHGREDDEENDVPEGQQSPSGSEYSPSGDGNDEDEDQETQHDRGGVNEGSMYARIQPVMGNNTDKYSVKHARSILRVNSVGNSNMVFQYVAKTVFPDMKFTEGDEELERELLEIALLESSVVIGDSRIPEAAFTQEYYPVVSKSVTKLRERTICSIRNKFLSKLIVDRWKFLSSLTILFCFCFFRGLQKGL